MTEDPSGNSSAPQQQLKKGNELQRLTPMENLGLGTLAGLFTMAVNYPLLTWKNMSQQGLKLPSLFWQPQLVYRGLPVAMVNLAGTTGLQFWFTGAFQQLLTQGGREGNMTTEAMLGGAFLGGVASGIPCGVWELIMIQQQRSGGSIWEATGRLVRYYGASALTRGSLVTMGRESLYTMAMLGVTPWIQGALSEKYENMDPSNLIALGAGSLIGAFVSATLTHPLDTVKTCMQGDVGREKYGNAIRTGRQLVQEHGGMARGLFKGLSWRITLIGTTFYLINAFKELLAPALFPHIYDTTT